MAKNKRAPGEGGVYPYDTKQGPRFYFKCMVPDPATGEKKPMVRRGFEKQGDALKEMRKVLSSVDAGTFVEPTKTTLAVYVADWLDGLRRKPLTIEAYRRIMRSHVLPHLGGTPLSGLTGPKITALYRKLEREGRRDGKGGLKASTVGVVHAVLSRALNDAVRAGLLQVNPASKAEAPSAEECKAPEMVTWSKDQLSGFLEWSAAQGDVNATAWLVAAVLGCRRGELLALRWRDIDMENGRIAIRRTVLALRNLGERGELTEGTPKSGKARVVDIDAATVAALKTWRKARGEISLTLRSPDALVFGTVENTLRHPDPLGRTWDTAVRRYNNAHPEEQLPKIHLHGLRHTCATLLLGAGVNVKVVSERLGHASAMVTLSTYAHAVPSAQQHAANVLGGMIHNAA